MLNTILMLLLSQSAAHAKATPVVDLLAEAARALPSIARVDLTGEVSKALRDGRTPPASPLRRQ